MQWPGRRRGLVDERLRTIRLGGRFARHYGLCPDAKSAAAGASLSRAALHARSRCQVDGPFCRCLRGFLYLFLRRLAEEQSHSGRRIELERVRQAPQRQSALPLGHPRGRGQDGRRPHTGSAEDRRLLCRLHGCRCHRKGRRRTARGGPRAHRCNAGQARIRRVGRRIAGAHRQQRDVLCKWSRAGRSRCDSGHCDHYRRRNRPSGSRLLPEG